MAVDGTHNELGSALTADCGSLNNSLGPQHRWPPEFVLRLIGCFCHKKLFFFSSLIYLSLNARESPNEFIVKIADAPVRGVDHGLRRARFTLFSLEFPMLARARRIPDVPGVVPHFGSLIPIHVGIEGLPAFAEIIWRSEPRFFRSSARQLGNIFAVIVVS
jgi:hypothetical protein